MSKFKNILIENKDYKKLIDINEYDVLGVTSEETHNNIDNVDQIILEYFNLDPEYVSLVYTDIIIRDRNGTSYYHWNDLKNLHPKTPFFVSSSTRSALDFTNGFDPHLIIDQYHKSKRLILHIPKPLFIVDV